MNKETREKKKQAINKKYKTLIKNSSKNLIKAIEEGDRKEIIQALSKAHGTIDKATIRNKIAKNKARKLKSKFSKLVNKK